MIIREENMEVANLVRDWLENEVKPVCAEFDEKGEFPEELYKGMTEIGLNTMAVPEEYGGLGLDAVTQTLIAEQMGRYEVGLGSAVGANASAVHLIVNGGSELQKQIFFGALVDGGWSAFALTEPDAGSNAAAIRTSYVEDGDDYVINGTKCFITNGGIASVYVVMATIDMKLGGKGIACFLIERDREGVSVGKHENKMGIRLSNTTEVVFTDVRIPKDHMIAGPGEGYRLALKTLMESRVNVGAMGVGLSARAVDEAIEYTLDLFCAFLSTAVSVVFGTIARFGKYSDKFNMNKNVWNAIVGAIIVAISMFAASFGLTAIVAVGYGYLGIIGIFLVAIPVLVVGTKKISDNKKKMAQE